MAFLRSILKPLCGKCPEPTSQELRNKLGKIAGVYCAKHAGAELMRLHLQETEGRYAPNGDGRIGSVTAASQSPAARGDSDGGQAA